ncbi:MAG TPA: alcohol dehydrogenase catalytic domain-containing protein [Acidimicrobiia bacterium]|jgi:NADPH:quinone reductase-like Zn-dependent oxidoreductase|nr:alcohol dehydrogenase catalytic domain-containing protein [Acidimicrobiia bacterium]
MRAIVLDSVPAPPEALVLRERPVPQPEPGWVLIEVKAFGLNRSELKTWLGLADPDVTLPRVPGIEATGLVAACPGGELEIGQQVVAMRVAWVAASTAATRSSRAYQSRRRSHSGVSWPGRHWVRCRRRCRRHMER